MKKIFYLFLVSVLAVSFSACGDDDDDNNGNGTTPTNPDGINGTWYCEKLEADIEADTEETKAKLQQRLASATTKSSIKLVLRYTLEHKYYYFDYNEVGGETGGTAVFKNNILTTNDFYVATFKLQNGMLYREIDDTETFKEIYPDTKKAVQRMWLKKK